MHDLNNFLGQNDLVEVDLSGTPFTWSNNRLGNIPIEVRLDSVLIVAGLNILPSTSVHVFPKSISDHSMILSRWAKHNP